MRGRRVAEALVRAGRDAVAHEKALGELLGALQLRRGARRAEDAQAARPEEVDDARGERGLRADHREVDLLARGEVAKLAEVGDRDVLDPGLARRTAISRRDEHFLHPRARCELPRERMLAAAGADHQELHVLSAGSAGRR
jgi:hypothetical protein